MKHLRATAAVVLSACGVLAGAFAGLAAYAAASWPRTGSGLLLAFAGSIAAAVLLVSAGVRLRGAGRWRVDVGRVTVAVGILDATVVASLPFVMRTQQWRSLGGPDPGFASIAIAFLGAAALAAIGAGLLSGTRPGRPFAERLRPQGPAPLRETTKEDA